MSVHRHVHHVAKAAQHVAKAAADAKAPSGGPAWLPGALKVGGLLLTVALATVGIPGAADAAESLNEIGRK
jgi:hypothetical protein